MSILTIFIALVIGLTIYIVLAAVLRRFWIGPPAEPDPEKMEQINVHFRCSVCGAEVTMTMAPQGEVPEPPRHCKEDMILVTSP